MAFSGLLHAAVLAAILLRLGVRPPAEPPPEPSIELRLVETQGAGPAIPAIPPSPPPEHPTPTPPPTPAPPPGPPATPAPEILPLPPPPPPTPSSQKQAVRPAPRRPQHAIPATPPEINLGAGDSLTNALASGPAVLPARADPHWRNREPIYPLAAAERGEHGAVTLLIEVGPDGAVTGIEIAETSGFLLLDRAAREAVQTWHFLPAIRDGQPVASQMPLRVTFQLN